MTRPTLWRHADFLHLWGAATISTYGSLVTRTALPFAAILLLDASPASISALLVAELLPDFLVGLLAGAWIDRIRRRPVMIAADLGRALLLATIPLSVLGGWFGFGHLYVVAALVSVLGVFFDVAYQSHLPAIVDRDDLIEANSKITASSSVAEAAAFSSGGWLIQLLTAPFAILVDAATFLVSAGLIARMRAPELRGRVSAEERAASSLTDEVRQGLRVVWGQPILRGLAGAGIAQNLAFGSIGTVFLLYVNQEVGFSPGLLGMIFAVGGVSSFAGAMLAGRMPRRGVGLVMIAALVVAALGTATISLATAANAVGIIFLVSNQLINDSALTVYEINQVSLRQAIAPPHVIGRVNATLRVSESGALLAGTLLGGYLGEVVGLRNTLWMGVGFSLAAALILACSPVRRLRAIPDLPAATPA